MENYEIQSKLGSGNFAKVYLAVHLPTQKEVALKMIAKSNLKSVKMFQRVHREINNMKTLGCHESIVSLLETFETPDYLVIAMEYLPGGELFDYVLERDGLTETAAKDMFLELARAVEHCHKNGIAHRDLKLENILLDCNNQPKIADFGLSKESHTSPIFATYCGSPLYTAPEMMHGKQYVGPECDVWSMGVILYTMLTATMPFDDSNFPKFMKKIEKGQYAQPNGVSDAGKDLISKMLDPNTLTRITMQDVLAHSWLSTPQKVQRKRKVGISQPSQPDTSSQLWGLYDCDCSCHKQESPAHRDSVITKHCHDCETILSNDIDVMENRIPQLSRNSSSTSSGYGSEFGSQYLTADSPVFHKRFPGLQEVRRNSMPRKSKVSIPHGRNSVPSNVFEDKPAYSTTSTCSSDEDDDGTVFI